MLLAIVAEARGDRDVEAFGRRLAHDTLQVAIAVAFVSATIVLERLTAPSGHHRADPGCRTLRGHLGICDLRTVDRRITASLPDAAKYVLSVLMFIWTDRHDDPCRGPRAAQPPSRRSVPRGETHHWLSSTFTVARAPVATGQPLRPGFSREAGGDEPIRCSSSASAASVPHWPSGSTRIGQDVLAVDLDPALIAQWSGRSPFIEADCTNPEALQQIGASDFPVAVVGVGSHLEASVLITGNLLDIGISQIWAKAVSDEHSRILTRLGAHHVVLPEADAGARVAHLLSGKMTVDYIQRSTQGFTVVKMHPTVGNARLHAGPVTPAQEVRRDRPSGSRRTSCAGVTGPA